jgi:ZIP family zinc transporter
MVAVQVAPADDDWVLPLMLSLLAGMSTCLGAAVVFCTKKGVDNKSPLSHGHMSFSLALAASVMVTVSVVSILPESFQDEQREEAEAGGQGRDSSGVYHMLPIGSLPFWHRCISIAAGCGLYFLLSKCAFPEPNAVLNLEDSHSLLVSEDDAACCSVVEDGAEIPLAGKSKSSQEDGTGGSVFGSSGSKNKGRLRKKESAIRKVSFQGMADDVETSTSSSFESSKAALLDNDSDKPISPEKSVGRKGRYSWWSLEGLLQCSSGKDLQSTEARRAWRVAMLLFVSIAVHNFPEGLAVAASTLHSPKLGWTTATAIALHNIPEGIAIAVPCLAARPDAPWLAFGLASLSGLAEPLGAAVALVVIRLARRNSSSADGSSVAVDDVNSFWGMNNILAFVSGVMIMVAVTELFPEALRHDQDGRWPLIGGTICGVVVMIGSDMILQGTE